MRCNETNPCREFTFDNVKLSRGLVFPWTGFFTENVYGKSINSKPDPGFLKEERFESKIEVKAVAGFKIINGINIGERKIE